MFSSKISAAKRLLGMAFVIAWATVLPLFAQTSITSNDGGIGTAGNLYGAVLANNGMAGGGNITLGITGSNSVTLQQALPAFSQSVTFLGNGTDQALVIDGEDESEAALSFNQNLSLGDSVTLNFLNDGVGGTYNLDDSLSVGGTLSMGATSAIDLTAGPGANGSNGGVIQNGGNGGNGGNASFSAAALTLSNPSDTLTLLGGNGGLGGAGGSGFELNTGTDLNGGNGGAGGEGGNAAVSAASISLSGLGDQFSLIGGTGGGGGTGGAGVSIPYWTAISNGTLFIVYTSVLAGGNGNAGTGGNGGDASLNCGNLSLGSMTALNVTGGLGGDGGNGVVNTNPDSTGGNGGTGGKGGNTSLAASTVSLTGPGALLGVLGGTGGLGGNFGTGTGTTSVTFLYDIPTVFAGTEYASLTITQNGLPGVGGNGGDAWVSCGNLNLASGTTFSVSGGAGGIGYTNGTAGSAFVTVGDLLGSGTVTMSGNRSLLWVNSGDFSGVIAGNESLDVFGGGALTLTGNNTYTGNSFILNGTLVAGSANALGAGSVALTGGTLALGGPVTVNITGNYVQSAGTTLRLGLGPVASQWDLLNISGTAALNGVFNPMTYNGFVAHVDESVTVLTASSVSGTFASLDNGVPRASVSLLYNPNSVVLELFANAPSFQSLGTTANQKNIGAALDALASSAPMASLVTYANFQSNSALPGVFDQVSPANLTPLYQMGFSAAQAEAGLVGNRVSRLFGDPDLNSNDTSWDGQGPMFAGDMPAAEEASISKGLEAQRWGVFVNGIGNFGTITGDGNGPGYQYSTGGMAAGMDYRFGKDLVGGLLLGYSSSGTSASTGTVNSNGGQVGLYAGWKQESLHIGALIAGGVNSYTTQRQTLGGTASGNTQGSQFSGELSVGYDMKAGDIKIQPFASGQYTNVGINAFTETGSMAPLSFGAQNESYLTSDLGATAQKKFDMGGWSLTPMVSAAWEHVYQGNLDSLSANFGSGSNFTVNGPALGTDAAVLGLGANATLAKGMAAYVSYQGKVGLTNYAEQNLSGGINLGF